MRVVYTVKIFSQKKVFATLPGDCLQSLLLSSGRLSHSWMLCPSFPGLWSTEIHGRESPLALVREQEAFGRPGGRKAKYLATVQSSMQVGALNKLSSSKGNADERAVYDDKKQMQDSGDRMAYLAWLINIKSVHELFFLKKWLAAVLPQI